MRSSLRPNPSDVVKPTVPAGRSRRPIGATGVTTVPPAGVTYASAAVRSPPMISSSRSDHTQATILQNQAARGGGGDAGQGARGGREVGSTGKRSREER